MDRIAGQRVMLFLKMSAVANNTSKLLCSMQITIYFIVCHRGYLGNASRPTTRYSEIPSHVKRTIGGT